MAPLRTPFSRFSPGLRALAWGALLTITLGSTALLASCQSHDPTGAPDGTPTATGAPMPPVLMAGSGPDRSYAAGPFTNLRWLGFVADRGSSLPQAWGWGDLQDGRQVCFTLATDGSLAATEIPSQDQPVSVTPVAGGQGIVGLRPSDGTGWYYPLSGEPASFGRVDALRISPSGNRLLAFSTEGAACVELPSLSQTVQPPFPSYESPPTGTNVGWVDDALVTVRVGEPSGGPEGLTRDTCILRLVSEPAGAVLATLRTDGDILSPFPSPDGRWLAVLHVDGDEFDLEPGNIIPPDIGREIRVYARDSLNSADPEPAAVLKPPTGHWLLSVVWAPDGSKLSCLEMEANASGDTERSSTVVAARAPDFDLEDIGLGLGSWSPGPFSPDGNKLFVLNWSEEALNSVIHDFAANADAKLAERLMVFRWVGSDRMAAFPSGYETGVPKLIDASTGAATSTPWPAASVSWFEAVGGSHCVMKVTAESAADLTGFTGGSAGEWLVLGAVASEP